MSETIWYLTATITYRDGTWTSSAYSKDDFGFYKTGPDISTLSLITNLVSSLGLRAKTTVIDPNVTGTTFRFTFTNVDGFTTIIAEDTELVNPPSTNSTLTTVGSILNSDTDFVREFVDTSPIIPPEPPEPPEPDPIPIFLDNFDGTGELIDHTPDIGDPWTEDVDRSYVLSDGKLDLGGNANLANTGVSNNAPQADIDITFDLTIDPNFNSGMHIHFNTIDDNNGWFIYHSPPFLAPVRIMAGVPSSLGDFGLSIGISGYTTIAVRIVTKGDNFKIYRDGVLAIDKTVADRNFKAATGFGLSWFRSSGFVYVERVIAFANDD